MDDFQVGATPLTEPPLLFTQTLLQKLEEGVATLNITNQITFCNLAFQQLVRCSAQSLLGQPITQLFPDWQFPHSLPEEGLQYEVSTATGQVLLLRLVPVCAPSGLPEGSLAMLSKRLAGFGAEQKRDTGTLDTEADKKVGRRESAEEKIQKKESLLASMQAVASFGLWEYHQADGHIHWSAEMYRIFGYQPGEVEVNLDLYDKVLHPDDRDRFKTEVNKILQDGQAYVSERRVIRPDGTLRYLLSTTDVVKDNEDNPVKVVGLTMDITDLKETQHELNEKQRFIERIAETTPDILYIYDIQQQRNVYANRRLPQVLGFSLEEVQQMGDRFLAMFTHTDDFPNLLKAMAQLSAASDSEVVVVEYRIMDAQGHWHWFYDRAIVFSRNADGSVREVLGASQDISERKQTQEKLAEKEYFIKQVANATPDLLYVYDLVDQQAVYVNREIEQLLGHTPEAFFSMEKGVMQRITHPNDWSPRLAHFEKLMQLANEEIAELEYRIQTVPGKWRWVHTRDRVFKRNADGVPCQIMGVVQDITERKAIESRVLESELLLRESQEIAHIGSYNWDILEDKITWTNEHYRIFGQEPGEPLQFAQVAAWYHPDDADRVSRAIQHSITTGQPFDCDFRIVRPDGQERIVWTKAKVFYNDKGEAVRFAGSVLDVTELKKAEAELQDSKHFIQQIADASPDHLYVFDLKQNELVYINREIYDTLGYEPNELYAQGNQILAFLMHPDDIPRISNHLVGFLTAQDSALREVEYRLKDKAGNWRWILARETVFKRDDKGVPLQITGVSRDISERKKAEEELRFKNKMIEGILSNLPVILCRIDRTGLVREAVGAGLQRVGQQNGDIVGHNIFTNESYQSIAEYIRLVLQGSRVTFIGTPTYQGKPYYFLNYYYYDTDYQEAIGFSLDITQQQETEQKLKQTEEQLRKLNADLEQHVAARTADLAASEDRYRMFVQQSSEAIWRFELAAIPYISTDLPEEEQLELLYKHVYLAECNDLLANMYGYKAAHEIIGARLDELLPRSEPANLTYLRNFIRSGYRLSNAESVQSDHQGNLKYFLNNLLGIVEEGKVIRAWGTQRDITARKQTEEALQEKEMEYRSLVTATSQMVWYTNADGLVTDDIPLWRRYSGQTREEVQGYGWINALHPDERDRVTYIWKRAVEQAQIYEIEYQVRDKQGKYRWFFARGVPIFDHNGNVKRWIGACNDIHDRKLAESALRASEARFRRLFESDMIGILFSDHAGTITDANNAFLQLIGYSREELQAGKIKWPAITPQEYAAVDEAAAHTLIAKNTVAPYEKEYIRKDGSRVTVLIGAALLREGIRGTAVAFVLDISEQKKAQEQLHASEERFQLVAKATNEGIWDWDIKGDQVWRNEGYYELFGYRSDSNYTNFHSWSQRLHPDDVERVKQGVSAALQSDHEHWSDEYRIGREDGTYAYVMDRAYILRDEQGKAVRMLGSKIDLTQLKEAQAALEQQAIELKQSNADLEQFAYISSHDLQEPLNTAASFAKLLKRRYESQLDTDAHEFIDFIVDATDRMKKIIRSLLEYSRISSTGKAMDQVAIAKVLEEVQQHLQPRLTAAGAAIQIGPMPTLQANEMQMLQLFQNLLSNAVKFRSAKPLVIRIEAEAQPTHWLFKVADNGIGIDMKHGKEKIFQVFQRLHSRDQYEGTGIGLAIVKKIIERHGGSIWVESEPGNGASFFFTVKK